MKFTTRELVTMAVFGALWGLVEISLGSVFHAIDLPLSGMALSIIGVMVASIGRLFVPKRGSTIFIGVIAMILKLFSIGSAVIGPMIGIFAEALIAELILDVFGKPSILAFIFACMGASLWTLVQPFVTGLLLSGATCWSSGSTCWTWARASSAFPIKPPFGLCWFWSSFTCSSADSAAGLPGNLVWC